MYQGNPNQPADPYAPQSYDRAPFQPGATNPYGYGYQRVAGQLAPQVSYRPYHQSNSGPAARQPQPMVSSDPYGMNQPPPQPVIISDPYGMQTDPRVAPQYSPWNYPNSIGYGARPGSYGGGPNVYHPLNGGGGMTVAPEPYVRPDEPFRRLGY